MFTDQRLHRAGALEPILGYDDVALLIDQGGLIEKYDTAFYGVQGVRPILGQNPHGGFVIWNQGGTVPAGYGTAAGNTALPPGCPTGSIAAGGHADFPSPATLQLGNYGLAQVRFTLEILALTGAVTAHDLALQVLQGQVGDFGLPQANPGFYSMIDQFQSPADQTVDPAQNANKALPAAFPLANPFDEAQLTEMYWFENNAPSFSLWNNGGAAITGGTALLRMRGYRYTLVPLHDDGTWQYRFAAGDMRKAPPGVRLVTVPTVPPTGTTQF